MRPDVYVLARLLHALHAGPQGRGDLQAATRLNYDHLTRYLGFLEERGLARPAGASGRKRLYELTAEGQRAYEQTVARVKAWVGPESHLRR